jgi:hypothetical protein
MVVDQERYEQAVERQKQQQRHWARQSFRAQADEIQRWLGVKVDVGRLDADEVNELMQLVAIVTRVDAIVGQPALDIRAWNIGALDKKETKRFERLVEKAADAKGWFKQRRQEERVASLKSELFEHARLASRPQRVKYVTPGTVQIPGYVFGADWMMGDNAFGIAELGLLVWVLGVLDNKVETVGAHFDGDEIVIEIDRFSLGGYTIDLNQLVLPRRRQILDELAETQLLTIKKAGNMWRISRGPALLAEDAARGAR